VGAALSQPPHLERSASIEQWAPECRIVYNKFHIIQHANDAVDEVRRAEFFRKGRKMRDLIRGMRLPHLMTY
jgi:transposase